MSEDLRDAKGYLGELGRSLLHARTIRVMGDWSHREAEKCGERRRTRQSATVLFTPLNSPHRQDKDGEAGTGHHHFHENGIPGGFAPYREREFSHLRSTGRHPDVLTCFQRFQPDTTRLDGGSHLMGGLGQGSQLMATDVSPRLSTWQREAKVFVSKRNGK